MVMRMSDPTTPRATLIEAMARSINDWITTPPFEWENLHPAARDRMTWAATDALDALLAALPGLGLRVVPVDATTEMIDALERCEVYCDSCKGVSFSGENGYAAAIAAAPDALEARDE